MKKSKGKEVDLIYSKPNKKSNKKTTSKTISKKNKNIINLDNEIIIGITPKKEINKKPIKKVKSKGNKIEKNSSTRKNYSVDNRKTRKSVIRNKEELEQKRRVKLKVFKWASIIAIIITTIILFMLSSVFNIREIMVISNNKVSDKEIINLSGISKDKNMFKLNIYQIKKDIKTNPYIEDVNIIRKLNGTVNIEVVERKETYMLEFANSYAYINNQGYVLEVSKKKLEVPILIGFKTETKDIEAGRRLIEEDLIKLGDIIKIMDSARGNKIDRLITKINISDSQDYVIELKKEKKTVHFGDISKVNQKIIWIVSTIDEEKGKEGELFFSPRVYFREKVS